MADARSSRLRSCVLLIGVPIVTGLLVLPFTFRGVQNGPTLVTVVLLLAMTVAELVGLARLQPLSHTRGAAYLLALVAVVALLLFSLGTLAMFAEWRDPGLAPVD